MCRGAPQRGRCGEGEGGLATARRQLSVTQDASQHVEYVRSLPATTFSGLQPHPKSLTAPCSGSVLFRSSARRRLTRGLANEASCSCTRNPNERLPAACGGARSAVESVGNGSISGGKRHLCGNTSTGRSNHGWLAGTLPKLLANSALQFQQCTTPLLFTYIPCRLRRAGTPVWRRCRRAPQPPPPTAPAPSLPRCSLSEAPWGAARGARGDAYASGKARPGKRGAARC